MHNLKTDSAILDHRFWALAREVLEQARAEGFNPPCRLMDPEGYCLRITTC